MTYNFRGVLDAWRNYPRQEHAASVDLFGPLPAQIMHPDKDGEQPSSRYNEPAASEPVIIGTTFVAPFEANVIAQTEQARHSVAGTAVNQIATIRSEIARVDYMLGHEVRELEAVRADIKSRDLRPFSPEYSKRIFWGVVVLVIAAEVPFNKVALDTFHMQGFEAWIVAVWLGCINFVAAKYVARTLRQRSWQIHDWAACCLAFAATAGVVFGLYGLAQLRENLPPPSDPAKALVAGSAMSLYALQTLAFVCGVAWSYFQVDPDRLREQLTGRHVKAEKQTIAL
jgi:hypothetical protein